MVVEVVLSGDALGALVDIVTRVTGRHLGCAIVTVVAFDEELGVTFQAGLFCAFHALLVVNIAGGAFIWGLEVVVGFALGARGLGAGITVAVFVRTRGALLVGEEVA